MKTTKLTGAVPMTALALLLAVFVVFFLYLMIQVNRIETQDGNAESQAITPCIEKYKSATLQINELMGLSNFCFGKIASQIKLDEERIIRDNYVFQRNENVVLLYMVVLVTLSGVGLAGLQLLASYELAAGGRGGLAQGGELRYSAEGVSLKSSVVGLMILAMSFAFFLVFIVYVYTFRPAETNDAQKVLRPLAASPREGAPSSLPDARTPQPSPPNSPSQ